MKVTANQLKVSTQIPYTIVKWGNRYVQVQNDDNESIKSKKTKIEKAKRNLNFYNNGSFMQPQ